MKKASKRLAIAMKHRELVRAGKYGVAYYLLKLLRFGECTLGLGDNAWEAECILDKMGCYIRRPFSGDYVTAFDFAR